jgi:hypothetical protein
MEKIKNYKDLKDAIENVSIQHIRVKKFDFGDNWESSVDGDGIDSYPKIYLETPILGSIDVRSKTYTCGIVCFVYPKEVYVKENHFDNVSNAAEILEQILLKLENDYKGVLSVTRPWNTVSDILATTSMLDYVRADVTFMVNGQSCIDESLFNINAGNL